MCPFFDGFRGGAARVFEKNLRRLKEGCNLSASPWLAKAGRGTGNLLSGQAVSQKVKPASIQAQGLEG
ncbi:MAG: hypothetical protein EBT58_00065 [Betaproteobacteria bacterium]|nr:hypothetical protein [Betaproteobacteria bacterium]